jgi:polar amino acid transport system substrate-binding protein
MKTIAVSGVNSYQVRMQAPAASRWALGMGPWIGGSIIRGCLVITFFVIGCSPKPHNKLIVGMELAYPPFEMTDEQGRPKGVSVDLANALGQHLGKQIEIQNIPFDGLIPSLKTRKIDLIISSMTATGERAQSIDFSEPYLKTGLCLLVGKNSSIQSIADLDQPGKTIAVKIGTTGHNYARERIKNAQVRVLEKEDACVLEVAQGKADAFIYDQMSTFKNWQRNPDTTRPLLRPFQEESWAIGARKGNTGLLQQVNRFLKEFRNRGGFEELGNRYLKEQKEAFRQMGYPFYF